MNAQLLTCPKPATTTMKHPYHLIIEETNSDAVYFEQMISIILVNTESFSPVFDISTPKKYEQNIIDMVAAKYGDNVKIYHIKEDLKGGKRNIPAGE